MVSLVTPSTSMAIIVAELLADDLDRGVGVFDHVVQEGGGDGGVVEAQLGADEGRADGMVDVVLAALAALPAVLFASQLEGARDEPLVEVGIVDRDGGQDALEQLTLLLGRGGERP